MSPPPTPTAFVLEGVAEGVVLAGPIPPTNKVELSVGTVPEAENVEVLDGEFVEVGSLDVAKLGRNPDVLVLVLGVCVL